MDYYPASICEGGHCVSKDSKVTNEYCEKCGSKIIYTCPNCKAEIRGIKKQETGFPEFDYSFASPYNVPKYCWKCGVPYPWIQKELEDVSNVINKDGELSLPEKDILNEMLKDMVVESPKTYKAFKKFKELIPKFAKATVQIVYNFLVQNGCSYVLSQIKELFNTQQF